MLKISKLSDYAMVIMSYLAMAPDTVLSAVEIAKAIKLGAPTVSKILKILCEAELVTSFRGTGGGYQLSRATDEITLSSIVSAMEGNLAMTECCSTDNTCQLDSLCTLKDNWKMINKIILTALAGFTLKDMQRPLTEHPLALKGIPIRVKSF